jgi:quinol monooxygenase YgiN
MFFNVMRIYPSRDEIEGIRAFLAGVLGPTRVQPGCLGCTLATESEPEALLYMEIWDSKADLLRRLRSESYSKVLATLDLSTRKPDLSVYEVIDQHGIELIEDARKT